ncbi:MAG: DsbA family protein [Actinomycetota bacterium]|nr:DsbA family protein [Actinomycetota bacterium]
MTEVEFFFDPSCPWTWVTSRWVATVAPERDLNVTWRTWSLPMKNEGRELPASLPAEVRAKISAGQAFSVRALRVLEASGSSHGNESLGRLYTELGRRVHGPDGSYDDSAIGEALAAAGLPPDLAEAGDDKKWDEAIRDNMDEVRRQIGDEVGVPIVALRTDGAMVAMSGPIMSDVPPRDESLRLWDAVATLVSQRSIFELKRQRTAGPSAPELDASGRAC